MFRAHKTSTTTSTTSSKHALCCSLWYQCREFVVEKELELSNLCIFDHFSLIYFYLIKMKGVSPLVIVFNAPYFSAVIDTTQTGRLDCAEVLKPFKETRQSLKLGN